MIWEGQILEALQATNTKLSRPSLEIKQEQLRDFEQANQMIKFRFRKITMDTGQRTVGRKGKDTGARDTSLEMMAVDQACPKGVWEAAWTGFCDGSGGGGGSQGEGQDEPGFWLERICERQCH